MKTQIAVIVHQATTEVEADWPLVFPSDGVRQAPGHVRVQGGGVRAEVRRARHRRRRHSDRGTRGQGSGLGSLNG